MKNNYETAYYLFSTLTSKLYEFLNANVMGPKCASNKTDLFTASKWTFSQGASPNALFFVIK